VGEVGMESTGFAAHNAGAVALGDLV